MMESKMEALLKRGGPYASKNAVVGGRPNMSVDVPITSVFLVLFILGAAMHMTIFQVNRRRSHKFLASSATFGFCMSRIATCTMRLAWATHPSNISVAIAAQIFVNAGVIIIIVVNLIFAQRILRASHPHIGWHRSVHFLFLGYLGTIIILLIMLITAIVQTSYTQSHHTLHIDRAILLTGTTYFNIAAFLPIPVVALSTLSRHIPPTKSRRHPTEKFGTGRFRTKIAVNLIGSSLICLGACFRCAATWLPRLATDPAWYDSRAVFYCCNFTVEIIVVYMYAIIRVDLRFHVPNGASGPGSYSTSAAAAAAASAAATQGAEISHPSAELKPRPHHRPLVRVVTEEEFDADLVPPEMREQDLESFEIEMDKEESDAQDGR